MIATGCDHPNALTFNLNSGDIKGATTQVIDEHDLITFLLYPIHNGGSGRLVEHFPDFETGDLACLRRGFALIDAEIGWTANDHIRNLDTQLLLSVGGQLTQDVGRDLFWGVVHPIVVKTPPFLTHMPLHQLNHLVRVYYGIVLCFSAHDAIFTVKVHDRGCGT